MSITRQAVIQAASDIADVDGLNKICLKVVAEKLNIRTPSLYNHIAGLDDLLREVAHDGMRRMNEAMMHAAIGYSGDAAIKSVSSAYLNSVIAHPGVYEIIQWAHWHGNDETAAISNDYRSLVMKLILSCNFETEKTDEILTLLISTLHGYSTLMLGIALKDADEMNKRLTDIMDVVLLGLHVKYDKGC